MVPSSYDVNISHDNHAIESENWCPIYKICLHQETWIHHRSIQGHFTSLINYNSSLHFTDKAMNLIGSCLLSSNHIRGLKFEPNLLHDWCLKLVWFCRPRRDGMPPNLAKDGL